MMHLNRVWPAIGALFLLFVTSAAFAQGNSADAPGHLFGMGQPHSVNDLPPGQLKSTLEGLSPKARGKALSWLQRFSFPAEDVTHLRVDSEGSIFYADPVTQDAKDSSYPQVEAHGSIDYADDVASATVAISQAEATTGSPAADPQTVFKLHSRPGSSNVIFLDFDGHTLRNTVWNDMTGQSVLEALPYDPSVNDSPKTVANFTWVELDRIAQIWHRMASDFVAFDIDITTEEPDVFTDTTGHMVFTDDADASGRTMPYPSIGGAAHVDVFGLSNYAADYPALVYYTNLWSIFLGEPGAVAEAASHQFGHQLGLSHDGVVGVTSFYQGSGLGMVKWAPIMGSPYRRNVTQWSQGEYPNASNPEDDLAIIAEKLGYIGDDHADLPSQATALAVDEDGTIVASSPELDPDNILSENKGVIGDRDDVDWFYVDVTGSGTLEITATPSWHSFTRIDERGSNLDIELSLFNSSLTLVAADEPNDETNAMVTAAVNPGRYYLQLDGVGNSTRSDYSDYASTGMYFIEGSVPTDTPAEPPLDMVFSGGFE
jgi:hypothetical protein